VKSRPITGTATLVARPLREQIDWDEVRRRTDGSP
jgi:hypothetical protein